MKKFICVLAAALLIVAAVTGCAKKESEVKQITVAVAGGFYPITYADDNGNACGYDVEVMKAVDELLPQYSFKFEITDKETMNVGVEAGTYQMGINSLFKTPERQEVYDMTENPMGYTPVGLIQREDDDIRTLSQAAAEKRTVYPVLATSGIRLIMEQWNAEHPDEAIPYELRTELNYADLFDGIRLGSYDFAVDLITVFNLQSEEAVHGLKISEPIDVIPTYPIIHKGEGEFKNDVEKALEELKNNGTLSKLSLDTFGYDLFEQAK